MIRPGAIGDFIVSIPAMESLRDGFLEVWCAGQNVPLAGFAGEARSIASTGLDLFGLPGREPPPGLLTRLRGFDRIASWYGANREEFVQALRQLGIPTAFRRALPPGGASSHAVDYYIDQVADLARTTPPRVPRIAVKSHARRGTVLIHPFAASPAKRWPLELFRKAARMLATDYPVEWTAGPEERLDEAVRFDNLLDLAQWLAGACVFVGNDSGISHLAAAVGTPVVALFGPTDPSIWAPRGPAVRVLRPLNSLTPEDVVSAVRSLCR